MLICKRIHRVVVWLCILAPFCSALAACHRVSIRAASQQGSLPGAQTTSSTDKGTPNPSVRHRLLGSPISVIGEYWLGKIPEQAMHNYSIDLADSLQSRATSTARAYSCLRSLGLDDRTSTELITFTKDFEFRLLKEDNAGFTVRLFGVDVTVEKDVNILVNNEIDVYFPQSDAMLPEMRVALCQLIALDNELEIAQLRFVKEHGYGVEDLHALLSADPATVPSFLDTMLGRCSIGKPVLFQERGEKGWVFVFVE